MAKSDPIFTYGRLVALNDLVREANGYGLANLLTPAATIAETIGSIREAMPDNMWMGWKNRFERIFSARGNNAGLRNEDIMQRQTLEPGEIARAKAGHAHETAAWRRIEKLVATVGGRAAAEAALTEKLGRSKETVRSYLTHRRDVPESAIVALLGSDLWSEDPHTSVLMQNAV